VGKIAVKLSHPNNHFSDDEGNKFVPHETRFVEETDRIKQSLKIGVLIRDREKEAALTDVKQVTDIKSAPEKVEVKEEKK
jgi:hypothetical protein